jgi:CRISPR-associated protein Cas1
VKKLLNTVYVTTEGASPRKDDENLVVTIEGAERARVPMHMLASVVTFGAIYLSPPLMQACAAAGATIVLLDRVGRFQARVEGPVSGNVLLRREQCRWSDRPEEIVKSIVCGKIANQRTVLQRALRDHGETIAPDRKAAIAAAIMRLGAILQRASFSAEGAFRLARTQADGTQASISR